MSEIKEFCPSCGSPNKPGNFSCKKVPNALAHLPGFLHVCNHCEHEFTFFSGEPVLKRENEEIPVSNPVTES